MKDERSKILVVGGAGYLGTVLTRRLLNEGYRVRILDVLLFGEDPISSFIGHKNFELVRGDVRNISAVTNALDGVDVVIHLAAVVGDPACRSVPEMTVETNFLAAKMLAEACKYNGIQRFIYASTCSIYGLGDGILTEDSPTNPVSLYAETKLKSEDGILGLTDKVFAPCSMRMATLHGMSPRMRFDLVVNTLSMHAHTKGRVSIFGGNQWRPLLHVDDAVESYLLALNAPIDVIRGQVFNVGSSGQNYRIIQLGRMIAKIAPSTSVEVEPQMEDARDYRVSFKKVEDILKFRPKCSVESSMSSILEALRNEIITNLDDVKYYNHFKYEKEFNDVRSRRVKIFG